MLILTRKKNESIVISDDIEVVILQSDDGKVKLGINAPQNVKIHRKEVYESIISENREAASSKVAADKLKQMLPKKVDGDS